jgi:hypothetical protein
MQIQRANNLRPTQMHRHRICIPTAREFVWLKTIPKLNSASSQVGGGFFDAGMGQRAAGSIYTQRVGKTKIDKLSNN